MGLGCAQMAHTRCKATVMLPGKRAQVLGCAEQGGLRKLGLRLACTEVSCRLCAACTGLLRSLTALDSLGQGSHDKSLCFVLQGVWQEVFDYRQV